MSKRSIKKRRHRSDFSEYMLSLKLDKETGGPMWKRLGYPTQALFQKYLDSKPKDSQMQLPPTKGLTTQQAALQAYYGEDAPVTVVSVHEEEHEHGEGCTHHSDDRAGT